MKDASSLMSTIGAAATTRIADREQRRDGGARSVDARSAPASPPDAWSCRRSFAAQRAGSHGRNSHRPRMAIRAGTSVTDTASPTSTVIAIAGPKALKMREVGGQQGRGAARDGQAGHRHDRSLRRGGPRRRDVPMGPRTRWSRQAKRKRTQ